MNRLLPFHGIPRPRLAPVTALSAALSIVALVGCGVPMTDQPIDVGTERATSTTLANRSGDAALPVRIFFLRQDRFDWVERRDTASSLAHPEFAIRNTVESLKAGLLPRERDAGFTSPLDSIVADTDLTLGVNVADGVAEIDLSGAIAVIDGLTEQQRREVVAQLALTALLATPGIGGVRFVADGQFLLLSGPTGTIGPEFHVVDFPCLVEDLTCSLPAVLLPDPVPVDSENAGGAADSDLGRSGPAVG
jgi:hypothetical protein